MQISASPSTNRKVFVSTELQHDDISSKKKKSVNLNKKIMDIVDKMANEISTKTGNVEPNFRTILSNQQPINAIQHEQMDLDSKIQAIVEAKVVNFKKYSPRITSFATIHRPNKFVTRTSCNWMN